jgi:transmembrane 9 superfamily protein 1
VSFQVQELKRAVEANYYFEMLVDNLPMRGYIGEVMHEALSPGKAVQVSRVYLYPHLDFLLGYNDDQIVVANVTADVQRRIELINPDSGMEIVFSYSVKWVSTPEFPYHK